MKLVFRKLEIHNFMSFADETICFDDFSGMTRITGQNFDLPNQKNGAGKSSISNSIVYALFGQLPFKLRNDNICNRYVKDKNVSVTLAFDSARRHFRVVSGMKGRTSYCNLYEIVKGEEKDITKSTIAETRLFLEREILRCDLNLFMRTIFLNSDPNYNFYNLKSADKKEFIDKLFDISKFGDMYGVIHRDVLAMDKDILAHQNRLIVMNNSKSEYEDSSREFDERKKRNIANLENEVSRLQDEYDSSSKVVVKRNTELISKCEAGILKLETAINRANEEMTKIDIELNGLKHSISRCNSSISDKQRIIDRHSELKSRLCDGCKEVFSDYYSLKKYENEISKLRKEVETGETKTSELKEKRESLVAEKRELVLKQEKLSANLVKLNSDYETAQRELRRLEMNLAGSKSRLEGEKSSSNPYERMILENDRKISEETSELSKIVDRYKYVKFIESMVNQENLKKFVIRDLVGLLNNKIKYYLHKLGADYDIVFDDEMDYDFVTEAKDGVEFNNFSKGEQARISIATCFAFRDFLSTRSNLSANILILDEFFDGNVDPAAIENTVDILNEFVRNNRQKIFIVSHRLEVNDDIFTTIMNVNKRNKISSIECVRMR
jgi:DNA repair exonuclease SbcCD ATPase subunit